jgi:hypothetical protein
MCVIKLGDYAIVNEVCNLGLTSMLFKIFCSCLVILGSSLAVFACSIPGMSPSRFDWSQYIFTGEVVGYVMSEKPIAPAEKRKGFEASEPTAGIVVKVNESLFTPQPVKKTYEVYRFGLGAGCELTGISVDFLKERYPVGQLIQVLAGSSDHLQPSSVQDVGRLEVRYAHSDFIYSLPLSDRTVRNSIDGPGFNYQKHQSDPAGDVSFEVLKDMLRLERTKNPTERDAIFERLTYHPRPGWLYELFKQYSQFPVEYDKWVDLARKRSLTEQAYKKYYEARSERKH